MILALQYRFDKFSIMLYNIVNGIMYCKILKWSFNVISSQMLKGVLEGCILKFIAQKETYAYEISRRLEEFGFEAISEGTIYPIILRLQKNNLIEAVFQKSKSGPKRKYYYLTEDGAQALEQFEENWRELELAVNHILNNGAENE